MLQQASLVFDLETIPDIEGIKKLNPDLTKLSDHEALEITQQQQIEKIGSDFMPLYLQKIVAIGCVFRGPKGFQVKCLGDNSSDERSLINEFFTLIENYSPTLISWNGSGFDLPVLHYRALTYGLTARKYWDQGEDNRDFKFNNYINRYHQRHIDLMDLLAKFNGRANAPLDQLAKLCGFPGKLGMDGSQVLEAFKAGQLDEIRAYCETDVVNTWLLYLRFELMRGWLDDIQYEHEITVVQETLSSSTLPHWKEYMDLWK